MSTFTVKWEIELYNSKTPLEAAKECLEDIIRGNCLCFTVINETTKEKFLVDLYEDDDNAVLQIKN